MIQPWLQIRSHMLVTGSGKFVKSTILHYASQPHPLLAQGGRYAPPRFKFSEGPPSLSPVLPSACPSSMVRANYMLL